MSKIFLRTAIMLFVIIHGVAAQIKQVDKKDFFTDERVVEMRLETDFKNLFVARTKGNYKEQVIPASITAVFGDSLTVTEEVDIRPRGEYRRTECYMPPIMVNFNTANAVSLKKLGRLKLVWPCFNTVNSEQLVLKEYLVYKIYNLLTPLSFRVRLVKMVCHDKNRKLKPLTFHAFFIEDVDDMAKRNGSREIEITGLHTELTNRGQTTLVALFEYMIGNTDWAVPINRNIKLIRSRKDSLVRPFVVPYDFDYCGLVNADYAIPIPELGITSVRQRLYLGFPRGLNELQEVLQLFRSQQSAINQLILNLAPLSTYHKKEMIQYIREFYEISTKERDIKEQFIDKAKKE